METTLTAPDAVMPPEQVGTAVAEALGKVTPNFVTIGEGAAMRTIPISFMPNFYERQVVALATPFIPRIMDSAGNAALIGELITEAADVLPKLVSIIAEARKIPDMGEDFIAKTFTSFDLFTVLEAQIQKYGEQDLLGKLFKLTGQARRSVQGDT